MVFVVYTGRSAVGRPTGMRPAVLVGGNISLARPTPPPPPRPTRRSGYRRARARTRDNYEREPETNTTDSASYSKLDGALSQYSNVIRAVRV